MFVVFNIIWMNMYLHLKEQWSTLYMGAYMENKLVDLVRCPGEYVAIK